MVENVVRRFRPVRAEEGYLTVEPKPSREVMEAFYRDVYFQETVSSQFQNNYSLFDLELIRLQNRLALTVIDQILDRKRPPRALLDVGCGEGFFMSAARELGYEAYGIDYSSYGVERHNPDVLPCFLRGDIFECLDQLVKEERSFTVVNLSGILEHVLDPRFLLLKVKRVLARQGVVRVLVPNDDSKIQQLAERLGKVGKFWFCPPQHLNYFNTATLKAFLERQGFVVKRLLGDFPIDYFLLNDWSNYVTDPARGKQAHFVRQHIQRLLHECGDEAYIGLQEAQARCGIGRDITAYATLREST